MSDTTDTCYSRINQGTWCQEWYQTGDKKIRGRARTLRRLGYKVTVSAQGSQVTRLGRMNMTMIDIRPGRNQDTTTLPPQEAR